MLFKQLRGPERLFRYGQIAIALLFAFFLSHVGSSLIADLPLVSRAPQLGDFLDRGALAQLDAQAAPTTAALDRLRRKIEAQDQAETAARARYDKQKAGFDNWLSARQITEQSSQNPEVNARLRELDALLKDAQALADGNAELHAQQQNLQQSLQPIEEQRGRLNDEARQRFGKAQRMAQLRAFGIRLLFVGPLLGLAVWLVYRHRKSRQWPFILGFTLFALNAFFFELVPYLPSFGGYVRYGVGAVLTFFVGRALISALQRYIERKQQEQAAPQETRKAEITYERALAAIGNGQCPSCERATPGVEGVQVDFCMHCGLRLFSRCPKCSTRRNAFFHFCPACGTRAEQDDRPQAATAPPPP